MLKVVLLYPERERCKVLTAFRELPEGLKPEARVTLVSCRRRLEGPRTIVSGGTVVITLPAEGDLTSVKLSLAHELAHALQAERGVLPGRVPPLRALSLPLECGAEELVLKFIPGSVGRRVEMGLRLVRRMVPRDFLTDLERSLVLEPVRMAVERLGERVSVPRVEPVSRRARKVREELVRAAREVDPWDPLSVRRYVEDARAIVSAALRRGA
ncbi:hypothetical protein [Methanopyrus sp.]